MQPLYLRKVVHAQAKNNYRVILKVHETEEFEIGSIGVQTFTSMDTTWVWGIDTVIPMRSSQSEGRGADRNDCMKRFRKAWEALTAREGWLEEFLVAKRRRRS